MTELSSPENCNQQHKVQGLANGGVLQGWIMGPMLFNIVMNDGTECTLSKFSDGTKLEGVTDPAHGFAAIERDLKKWRNGRQEPHEVQ